MHFFECQFIFLPRHDLLVVFVVSLMRMAPFFGVVWLSEIELACLPLFPGVGGCLLHLWRV